MVSAYVLVKFNPSADLGKVQHALQQPGVKGIDMLLGPYDAFVRCEAADMAALGALAKAIRGCPGIQDSLTCLII
ncbi:MAG: Lrp/AsnC ligand binding domain-containing protein [Chloroflexi bacterium]|nr:Lrp/AsnC ligand binding domain-containing protein [Chloroflexota bacterium]